MFVIALPLNEPDDTNIEPVTPNEPVICAEPVKGNPAPLTPLVPEVPSNPLVPDVPSNPLVPFVPASAIKDQSVGTLTGLPVLFPLMFI